MIHIKELCRLQKLSRLRLIAGEAGLERTVTAAVLFEYDPSRMQLPDFYRGDLVVTTLAYARGDAQLVANSLIALMNQGIAGLLVKTAYFSELPRSVIDLAQTLGTPIFLFDDTYIEEVILEVTDLIRGKRHFSGYEKELDELMRGGLTQEQMLDRIARIDPAGSAAYRIAALCPRERMPLLDEQIYTFLCADERAASRFICMQWRRMLIVLERIAAKEKPGDFAGTMAAFLAGAGIDASKMSVGLSDVRREKESFGVALSEAVYAARTARLRAMDMAGPDELGLHAYLLPLAENAFARAWCRRTLRLIREYDAQNKANLEATARVYIESDMKIAAAAEALFQHANTVRYRLDKVRQIMQLEDSPMFLPMLCLTMELSAVIECESE